MQVNPSAMAAQTEVVSSTDSVVKYPGQEGLYTSVGLTSSADVTASVRGETWCPMALAWYSMSWSRVSILAFLSLGRNAGVPLKVAMEWELLWNGLLIAITFPSSREFHGCCWNANSFFFFFFLQSPCVDCILLWNIWIEYVFFFWMAVPLQRRELTHDKTTQWCSTLASGTFWRQCTRRITLEN